MTRSGSTYIIAEAGVNHNGDLETAKRLVEVAAKAGADAVKFQSFKAENLVCGDAPKAPYQRRTTGELQSQFEMIKDLELNAAAHRTLMRLGEELGIQFLSSPFDLDSVDLLADDLQLPILKIPSGEVTNALLLLRAARTGRAIILSTGMCTLGELESALGVIAFGYLGSPAVPSRQGFFEAYCSEAGQRTLKQKVTLLHCTTEYPAPFAQVNLRAMDTLRSAFRLRVGLSDHTPGLAVPIAAVARGAAVVEKHFTLDRGLPGPDHRASLDPGELSLMVKSIREVESALGLCCKVPAASELQNMPVARKSLVAAQEILAGELYSERNLAAKRPGDGISPLFYWDLLGKAAPRSLRADEQVSW